MDQNHPDPNGDPLGDLLPDNHQQRDRQAGEDPFF